MVCQYYIQLLLYKPVSLVYLVLPNLAIKLNITLKRIASYREKQNIKFWIRSTIMVQWVQFPQTEITIENHHKGLILAICKDVLLFPIV